MALDIIVEGVRFQASGGNEEVLESGDQFVLRDTASPDAPLATQVLQAVGSKLGSNGTYRQGAVQFTVTGAGTDTVEVDVDDAAWARLKQGASAPASPPASPSGGTSPSTPLSRKHRGGSGGGGPKNTGDAAKLEEKYNKIVEKKLDEEMEDTSLSAQSQKETRDKLKEAVAKLAAEDAKGGKKTVSGLLKKGDSDTTAHLEKKIQLSQLIKEAKAGATLSEGNEKRLVSVYKAAIEKTITGVLGISSEKVKALLAQFSPAATDMAALDRNTGDWGRMDATPDELVPFVKSELPHLGRALQEAQAETYVDQHLQDLQTQAVARLREEAPGAPIPKDLLPSHLTSEEGKKALVAALVSRMESGEPAALSVVPISDGVAPVVSADSAAGSTPASTPPEISSDAVPSAQKKGWFAGLQDRFSGKKEKVAPPTAVATGPAFDSDGTLIPENAKKILDELTGGADQLVEGAVGEAKQARAKDLAPQMKDLGDKVLTMGKEITEAAGGGKDGKKSDIYEMAKAGKGADGKGGYTSPFAAKLKEQAEAIAEVPKKTLDDMRRDRGFMHAGEKVGTSPSWKPANTTFTPRDYAHRKTGKIDEFGV